jgi:hypothetical protein
MNERRYLEDVLRMLVSNVETKVLPTLSAYDENIVAISYEFGHPREVLETQHQKDESNTLFDKKYPLVWLFTDIKQKKGLIGKYSLSDVRIIVAHHTNEDYKADERKELVFKPVIHPIVDALMQEIALSPYFLEFNADMITRTETDRYFWGRIGTNGSDTTANIANEFIDATDCEISLTLSKDCIFNPLTTNIKK